MLVQWLCLTATVLEKTDAATAQKEPMFTAAGSIGDELLAMAQRAGYRIDLLLAGEKT